MPRKPETGTVRSIAAAIKKEWPNSWGFKVHGGSIFQEPGIPDRLHCIEGYFFAIEAKHPDQSRGATALQLANIEEINKAGGCAFVSSSASASIRKIKRFLAQKELEKYNA